MQHLAKSLEANKQAYLDQLFELLRIPSISADSAYTSDVKRAADYLVTSLKNAGLQNVECCPTAGHPIVYGEKIIDPNKPTILVYGHYDVQPPDPIELWESGPFDPVIKNEKIICRGACDDKGQMFAHVKAIENMIQNNALPCNVKIMIEGEEESGSNSLEAFLQNNKERLKADVILVSDTSIIANDTPSIECGLRGLSYLEVTVTGAAYDLHSGVYGGAVANPINVLSTMIAALKDDNNRITIPGFYDDVYDLTPDERNAINAIPFNLENYKQELTINDVHGEAGYSTIERTSTRPTLDVNGIWGGYTGEGAKTVLPSKAHAKISMRLVPHQSSAKITALFQDHFSAIAPPSVTVSVTPHHGGEPVITPTDSKAYKAAEQAMEATFGKKPLPTRGGGSIPIIALFEKELGLKSVLMGFGLDSDKIHSPNEEFGLFNYYKAIETIPYFYHYFSL